MGMDKSDAGVRGLMDAVSDLAANSGSGPTSNVTVTPAPCSSSAPVSVIAPNPAPNPVWGGELGRLCNSFVRFDELYGRFAKSYGESYFSLWTLEEIGDRPEGITQKEMTSLLHLPKQTLSSIVASLVKRGLVETNPSPIDRRSKVHTLTEAGRSLYERERADLTRVNDELIDRVGAKRIKDMNDTFEEMNDELERAFERLFDERVRSLSDVEERLVLQRGGGEHGQD